MAWAYVRAVIKMNPPPWSSTGEFATLVMLASYAAESGDAFPSKTTLSKALGTSERAIYSYVRALRDKGLIALTEGGQPGGRKFTRYRMLFPPDDVRNKPTQARFAMVTAADSSTVPVENFSPRQILQTTTANIAGDPGKNRRATVADSADDPVRTDPVRTTSTVNPPSARSLTQEEIQKKIECHESVKKLAVSVLTSGLPADVTNANQFAAMVWRCLQVSEPRTASVVRALAVADAFEPADYLAGVLWVTFSTRSVHMPAEDASPRRRRHAAARSVS